MEYRVSIIDDDKIFNLMASVMLRDIGVAMPLTCFTDGREALAYIKQHTAAAHLVFLDINMPTMSGWEVLEALETLDNPNDIHVVIVTSSIDRADQKKALEFDLVVDYMIKPLKRETLSALKQHEKLTYFF